MKQVQHISIDGQDGYVIESLQLVEQLQEAMAPTEDFTRMKPGSRKEDGSYELTYAEVPKRKISMANGLSRISRKRWSRQVTRAIS